MVTIRPPKSLPRQGHPSLRPMSWLRVRTPTPDRLRVWSTRCLCPCVLTVCSPYVLSCVQDTVDSLSTVELAPSDPWSWRSDVLRSPTMNVVSEVLVEEDLNTTSVRCTGTCHLYPRTPYGTTLLHPRPMDDKKKNIEVQGHVLSTSFRL